jgi:hypothetical protein
MHRSQFNLFRDIGQYLFGNSADALRFAMDRIARPDNVPPRPVIEMPKPSPQMALVFENVNP